MCIFISLQNFILVILIEKNFLRLSENDKFYEGTTN